MIPFNRRVEQDDESLWADLEFLNQDLGDKTFIASANLTWEKLKDFAMKENYKDQSWFPYLTDLDKILVSLLREM